MQDTLTIALVQADLLWENPEANRHALSKKIVALFSENQKTDVIILPEMFTTSF